MREYIVAEDIDGMLILPVDRPREEIVRCRDCRFSPDEGQTCEYDGDEFNVTLVHPDGFCAWGERRQPC